MVVFFHEGDGRGFVYASGFVGANYLQPNGVNQT
jgi:hypothetical protein